MDFTVLSAITTVNIRIEVGRSETVVQCGVEYFEIFFVLLVTLILPNSLFQAVTALSLTWSKLKLEISF